MYRSNYDIAFFNKPVVELIGRIPAIRFTDSPGFFIFSGAFGSDIELPLHRAFHILAEFSSFIVDISVN